MKQGVLLLAHGAPERVEDVESYLTFVRGGRPGSPRIVEEVERRYQAIGGSSPLLAWTRTQADALERMLGIPVFFGMRNWHPFIRETMDRVREAGVAAEIRWARSFHDEPLLVEAFAEKLETVAAGGKVLFTAHSVPEKALAGYDREARTTAAAVAARLGLADWDFAYQSQGLTDDRWLGPTVESCLDRYAAGGIREVVVDPIGFVCDHVETLYDVDVVFRHYAAERGISLVRPDALNGSEKFTAALAEVAKRCL
jgi:ferrochelatase